MPGKRVKSNSDSSEAFRPALTPEARENQMIALAVDTAEKQMREGTASSAIIVHYLNLATLKYKIELENLKKDNELKEAKTKTINDAKDSKELYKNALDAMRRYSGSDNNDDSTEN